MVKQEGRVYLLTCDEDNCEAEARITILGKDSLNLPIEEIREEADKVNWEASLIPGEKTYCSKHRRKK